MATSSGEIALFKRVRTHSNRTVIVAAGKQYTFGELLSASARVAAALLDGSDNLREARVAFLVQPGFEYVAAQWGIWRAGGVAVPLAVMHPPTELAYTIEDSDASVVVADKEFEAIARELAKERGVRFLRVDETANVAEVDLPGVAVDQRAMILYTSGTTGRPKGVVTTHANIAAQIESLVEAWRWTSDDYILHFLPLHHIHGIINVLCCALWSGATCEFLPKFDAEQVWQRMIESRELTLLMAVPTIYSKLIAHWQSTSSADREAMSAACQRLRLMVSGSAALPVSTLELWRSISGHTLLERYGMTEIGMALSNPLEGERLPGRVGSPLPGVEVRLVNEAGQSVRDGQPGEIQVRGPNVFLEYWQRPDATREAFTSDGWFKTGDVAQRADDIYQILGRDSVDIIKTGGYKVSALEIEEVLRNHDAIAQCAVVGVEDPEWGQRVCAAVVLDNHSPLDLEALRAWSKPRLAPYKIPTRLIAVDTLPRNAMGKVTKSVVAELFVSRE